MRSVAPSGCGTSQMHPVPAIELKPFKKTPLTARLKREHDGRRVPRRRSAGRRAAPARFVEVLTEGPDTPPFELTLGNGRRLRSDAPGRAHPAVRLRGRHRRARTASAPLRAGEELQPRLAAIGEGHQDGALLRVLAEALARHRRQPIKAVAHVHPGRCRQRSAPRPESRPRLQQPLQGRGLEPRRNQRTQSLHALHLARGAGRAGPATGRSQRVLPPPFRVGRCGLPEHRNVVGLLRGDPHRGTRWGTSGPRPRIPPISQATGSPECAVVAAWPNWRGRARQEGR
jgi:hypothetical protein